MIKFPVPSAEGAGTGAATLKKRATPKTPLRRHTDIKVQKFDVWFSYNMEKRDMQDKKSLACLFYYLMTYVQITVLTAQGACQAGAAV